MSEKPSGRIAANAVANQIAQRRAVADMLERNRKLFVCRKTFHRGRFEARVLIDGRYFDVDERQLGRLREGRTPDDLMLDEVEPRE